MEIRPLQRDDLINAVDLAWTVFQEFVAPYYSREGIEEFRRFISHDAIIKRFNKGELSFWGCIADGDLVGVIATQAVNHICMFFVKKEYHRRGIGRRLLQAVEEACKGQGNIIEITVNSSPYAIEVYHRLGFVDTDKEQTVNGIRFIPMSYSLR